MTKKYKGEIKFYNEEKCYGFITVPELNKDIFFSSKTAEMANITKYDKNLAVEFELNCSLHDKSKIFAINIRAV